LPADKKTVYIVFGKHTGEIARYLSKDFNISGQDRTLEAAIDSVKKLENKPDIFLIAGTALITGLSEQGVSHGRALLENLKKIRVACPESRVKVLLSEKASDELVKGIVSLGIYDIYKEVNLSLPKLLKIMNDQKTIADHVVSVPNLQYVENKKVEMAAGEKCFDADSKERPVKERFFLARKGAGKIISAFKKRCEKPIIEKPRRELEPQKEPVPQNEPAPPVQEDIYRDLLTGCFTRRFLLEKYNYDGKFVVVFIDLDKFKPVNDILGHEAGDRVLSAFGRMLCVNLKNKDVAVRWGGDEFVLILPGTSDGAARKVVDNLKEEWEKCAPDTGNLRVGFSAGVASGEGYASLQEVIKKADKLMYEAKQERRPKAEASSQEVQPVHKHIDDPFQTAVQVFKGLFSVLGTMIAVSVGICAVNYILSFIGKTSPTLDAAARFVLDFWRAVYIGAFS
jgi:diguanylate cyclase (GGDEF)-like protein